MKQVDLLHQFLPTHRPCVQTDAARKLDLSLVMQVRNSACKQGMQEDLLSTGPYRDRSAGEASAWSGLGWLSSAVGKIASGSEATVNEGLGSDSGSGV